MDIRLQLCLLVNLEVGIERFRRGTHEQPCRSDLGDIWEIGILVQLLCKDLTKIPITKQHIYVNHQWDSMDT
jgi:hypothetical protein